MGKFVISPHFRLQEWVAEEKGYFALEGLDYQFQANWDGEDLGKTHATPNKVGAYQNIEKGRESNVSCACHWTVNVASSAGHGKLYADCYSVAPSGIFVAPESGIRTPQDLAGVPISVGFQSGSHYSTLQALEQYLKPEDIKLSFADGILFGRMEKLVDRKVPACALFSGPYYFVEQLGFRKVIDTTFMIATMLTGDPDPEDVKKYFRALRSAQRDIDLRPELYTHYYRREFPKRFLERWTRAAGGRASGWCSSPTRARSTKTPSAGSRSARSSRTARWGRAATRTPSARPPAPDPIRFNRMRRC